MTEQQHLLAEIISNPDYDTVRLVFADWLEEHDDPYRAAFIRAQVEYAKYERVVLSRNDAMKLTYDHDLCTHLMQSPYSTRAIAGDHGNPNGEWGLPARIMGIEIEVQHDARDSGYTTLNHFRKLASDPRRRELKEQMRESCGPHEDGSYGERWWKWFGDVVKWGNNQHDTGPPNGNRYINIHRGFIESVTCTADDWFQHAEEVWWHRDKTIAGERVGDYIERAPRPCPLTAQPLRKVVMTTSPVVSYEIEHRETPHDMIELRARMVLGDRNRISSCMVFQKQDVLSRREITASSLNLLRQAVERMDRELPPRKLLGEWFKGVEFELTASPNGVARFRGFPAGTPMYTG